MNTTPQPLTLEPQTPQEEPQRTVRDVLLGAARYIEEHGWCQEVVQDASQRVCLVGAIKAASGYDPAGIFPRDSIASEAAQRMFVRLGGTLEVHDWNDAPERTEAEVLSALREAARSL